MRDSANAAMRTEPEEIHRDAPYSRTPCSPLTLLFSDHVEARPAPDPAHVRRSGFENFARQVCELTSLHFFCRRPGSPHDKSALFIPENSNELVLVIDRAMAERHGPEGPEEGRRGPQTSSACAVQRRIDFLACVRRTLSGIGSPANSRARLRAPGGWLCLHDRLLEAA